VATQSRGTEEPRTSRGSTKRYEGEIVSRSDKEKKKGKTKRQQNDDDEPRSSSKKCLIERL
jgi:hypothetical protein